MAETVSLPESLSSVVDMTGQAIEPGCLGAIAARAGVGKTSFLVQIALHAMLSGRNILHFNLTDPLKKNVLWYKEVFSRLVDMYPDMKGAVELDAIINRRFIMTMKVGAFSVGAMRERLADLVEQEIFSPHLLIVDGLNFDEPQEGTIADLKTLAQDFSLQTWVAMPVHREDLRDDTGLPARLSC